MEIDHNKSAKKSKKVSVVCMGCDRVFKSSNENQNKTITFEGGIYLCYYCIQDQEQIEEYETQLQPQIETQNINQSNNQNVTQNPNNSIINDRERNLITEFSSTQNIHHSSFNQNEIKLSNKKNDFKRDSNNNINSSTKNSIHNDANITKNNNSTQSNNNEFKSAANSEINLLAVDTVCLNDPIKSILNSTHENQAKIENIFSKNKLFIMNHSYRKRKNANISKS